MIKAFWMLDFPPVCMWQVEEALAELVALG